MLIPRYIALAKLVSLVAASLTLLARAAALFIDHFQVKTIASLFASLLLPLWMVDHAERKFGRWECRFRGVQFSFQMSGTGHYNSA